MAKLGIGTMAAAALLSTPAAAAPPASAEDALARQQASLRSSLSLDCDRESDEIVVCGRRGADPYRLPLPVERLPGARENLLPGELPRAQASFSTCVVGCQPMGIVVDPFQVIRVGSKIVRHILGKDD